MPRQIAIDDDMPRRRRRATAAVAVDDDTERGLLMRILLHSPKDMIAGALAFTAVTAIVANALFLQAGHHPSPMFGAVIAVPPAGLATASAGPATASAGPATASAGPAVASPMPRPRPAEAAPKPVEATPSELRATELKPSDIKLEQKPNDPMTSLVRATSTPPAAPVTGPRPPASIPVAPRSEALAPGGSRRVAAVQRALTENGYGQLKATGTIGADTQAAIQKFERARRIPVTGQMSDRLVRELIAMIGHPID